MRYSEMHEWIDLQGKIAKIGVTQYAQEQIGEVVYVELPKIGSIVKVAEEVAVIESTKAAIDYYTPVSGKIIDINIDLKEHPEWINSDPEKKGWIFKIEVSNLCEVEDLMDFVAYQKYLAKI